MHSQNATAGAHEPDMPGFHHFGAIVLTTGYILMPLQPAGLVERVLRDVLLRFEQGLSFGSRITLAILRHTASIRTRHGIQSLGNELSLT
jgi:hypothetical protein